MGDQGAAGMSGQTWLEQQKADIGALEREHGALRLKYRYKDSQALYVMSLLDDLITHRKQIFHHYELACGTLHWLNVARSQLAQVEDASEEEE